jgi:DNA-binding response OmpR family regulator
MAKGKVLIVDDEIYIIHILDFTLGMEGYEVITALSGEQAIEKAVSELPDLIVLDAMMPKLDGFEVMEALNSIKATRLIPVILVSPFGRNIEQRRADSLGAVEMIAKPFSPRKLVERINTILGVRTV